MRIEVILTETLFRRFTLFDMMKRKKVWRSPATFAGIMSTSAFICFLMHHVDGAILLGSVLLLVGLGMPAAYFISFGNTLRRQITVYGLKTPKKVYTLYLSKKAEGISVSNEQENVDYKWANVYHVYRDKEATYLFMNAQRGFILPHNCVPEGPDKLWELLERTLPKQKLTVLK